MGALDHAGEGEAQILIASGEEYHRVGMAIDGAPSDLVGVGDVGGVMPVQEFFFDRVAIGVEANVALALVSRFPGFAAGHAEPLGNGRVANACKNHSPNLAFRRGLRRGGGGSTGSRIHLPQAPTPGAGQRQLLALSLSVSSRAFATFAGGFNS